PAGAATPIATASESVSRRRATAASVVPICETSFGTFRRISATSAASALVAMRARKPRSIWGPTGSPKPDAFGLAGSAGFADTVDGSSIVQRLLMSSRTKPPIAPAMNAGTHTRSESTGSPMPKASRTRSAIGTMRIATIPKAHGAADFVAQCSSACAALPTLLANPISLGAARGHPNDLAAEPTRRKKCNLQGPWWPGLGGGARTSRVRRVAGQLAVIELADLRPGPCAGDEEGLVLDLVPDARQGALVEERGGDVALGLRTQAAQAFLEIEVVGDHIRPELR